MKNLEKKIEEKAERLLRACIYRDRSGATLTEPNIETFVRDTKNAMLKIIKAEVNIRLQEIRHSKNNQNDHTKQKE